MKTTTLLITAVVFLGLTATVHAKHSGGKRATPTTFLPPTAPSPTWPTTAAASPFAPTTPPTNPAPPNVAVIVNSATKITVNGVAGKTFADLKVGVKVHCVGGGPNSNAVASITATGPKS
jgi:hypothetical protein